MSTWKRTTNASQDVLKARKATGMNQADFWGKIGTTQSGGCRYEKGRDMPHAVAVLVDLTYGTKPEKILKGLGLQ